MEITTLRHGKLHLQPVIPEDVAYLKIPGSEAASAVEPFGTFFFQQFKGEGYGFMQSLYKPTQDIQINIFDESGWLGFRLMQQHDLRHHYAGGQVYLKQGQYWFAHERKVDCKYQLKAGGEYLVFDMMFDAGFIRQSKLKSAAFNKLLLAQTSQQYAFLGERELQSDIVLLDAVESLLMRPAEPALARQILVLIAKASKKGKPARELSEERIAKMYAAREIIRGDILMHHSIEELAKMIHLNDRDFRGEFAIVFGMPPYSYLQHERVKAAKQYLFTTTLPLTEIAGLTGFKRVSSFIKVFKEHTGMTPVLWRRTVKDFV